MFVYIFYDLNVDVEGSGQKKSRIDEQSNETNNPKREKKKINQWEKKEKGEKKMNVGIVIDVQTVV